MRSFLRRFGGLCWINNESDCIMTNTQQTERSEAKMLDIRDIQTGNEYFVITSDERGGRCVMNNMFIAAWETRKEAKEYAATLGAGFHVVKTVKP